MASSYDNDLRLNEMATGDQSGAWGTVTNLNLEMIAEAFSYGTRAIANASTDNITLADGASDADRSMYLKLTGGGQACTVTFLPATISKVWLIENATSYTLTFTQGSSGANVAVLAGQVKMIATDGGGSTNGVVYDLFTDVNFAGTTNLDAVDIDGAVQLDATLAVGVDDTGYDVKFFGDTASAFMQWDASADDLILGGAAGFVLPKDKLTIDSTAVTTTAAELNKLDGAGTLKQAGKESIYVPATAMYPSTTNPCSDLTQVETTALRPDLKVLDFAAAADDFAQFSVAFPKSWNEGTVTFQPFWTVTGTDSGTVAWQLAGVAITSDESINTAFGTQVATTALAFSATSNDLMVSAESGAVTIAGSPAAADMCFFQINRDTSADTQTGDARLLGVKLLFTTDAANDA